MNACAVVMCIVVSPAFIIIAIFFRTFSAQLEISVVSLVGTTVAATTMPHKEVEVIV